MVENRSSETKGRSGKQPEVKHSKDTQPWTQGAKWPFQVVQWRVATSSSSYYPLVYLSSAHHAIRTVLPPHQGAKGDLQGLRR